jgi:HAD superfamily hydrolase (TIGR01450 family)
MGEAAVTQTLELSSIDLYLFDIDGVFLAGKQSPRLISGLRIVAALRERSLPFRLVTNTSTHPRTFLVHTLKAFGLSVRPEEIHSALEVTVDAARERFGAARCFVVGEDGMRQLARQRGLEVVDGPPADLVLVGLSRYADYRILSLAARCLREGAHLLGCHRNRMWKDDDGPGLSCGPWLAALEQATGAQANTFGKPEPAFYAAAREPLRVPPERTLMVGDDAEVDIAGAQRTGMKAGLVLTGKTSREALGQLPCTPELILNQVDDLADLL